MAEAGCEGKLQLDDVRQTVTCGICLQLLTDPRGLTCGHTYCLVCLQGFQKSSSRKECPVCRAMSVPAMGDLERLPHNKLAANIVGLVHSYEPSSQEPPVDWKSEKNTPEDDNEDQNARIQMIMAMLEGLSQADEDDGSGLARHRSVICDHCRTRSITGARFKCGICDDYDLCGECAIKPRDEVHDIEHIFIKIKKPRTASAAMRRVLHDDSTVMGMSQDATQKLHTIGVGNSQVKIHCDKCKASPISGVRYKCGVCRDYDLCETCEETSAEFHDPKHIFLVLLHPVGLHTTTPQLIYNFYD